jgi:hypothetical protein
LEKLNNLADKNIASVQLVVDRKLSELLDKLVANLLSKSLTPFPFPSQLLVNTSLINASSSSPRFG